MLIVTVWVAGTDITVTLHRPTLGDPPLPHEVSYYPMQCRLSHAEHSCGVRRFGVRMTTQIEGHISLEESYADRLQASFEIAVQLQHAFQQRQLLRAIVRDPSHGQCVASLRRTLLHRTMQSCLRDHGLLQAIFPRS